MFIPLSPDLEDLDLETKSPTVNLLLIGLTCFVSLSVLWGGGLGDDLESLHALALRRGDGASPVQLIGHALLHADGWHLLGNVICLFAFGNAIEMRLGHMRYLGLYLGLCVAAALSWLFLGSGPAAIGASGVAMGLAGMFFLLFPRLPMNVFVWAIGWILLPLILTVGLTLQLLLVVFIGYTIFSLRSAVSTVGGPPEGWFLRILGFRTIKLAGCWIMPIFVAQDVFALAVGQPDNVAHMAHLGGAAAGVLLALGLTGYGLVRGTHVQPTFLEWIGVRPRVERPRPTIFERPQRSARRTSARLRRATTRKLSFSDWQRQRLEQEPNEHPLESSYPGA